MRDCLINVTEQTKQEINDLHLGFDTTNVTQYKKENLQVCNIRIRRILNRFS